MFFCPVSQMARNGRGIRRTNWCKFVTSFVLRIDAVAFDNHSLLPNWDDNKKRHGQHGSVTNTNKGQTCIQPEGTWPPPRGAMCPGRAFQEQGVAFLGRRCRLGQRAPERCAPHLAYGPNRPDGYERARAATRAWRRCQARGPTRPLNPAVPRLRLAPGRRSRT